MLRTLLAGGELPLLPPTTAQRPSRSFLHELFRSEPLPPPDPTAVRPRRAPSFLTFILASERLPAAGAATPKAKTE